MMNMIWGMFIFLGIVYSLITGNIDVINKEILSSAKLSLDMVLQIFPIMAVWLGLMNIAKLSGLLQSFAKLISPVLGRLFPELPKNHEALGFIASNVVINMFGLGSAATPFGLKAMKSLQEINDKKDTASRTMITFLVLNTGGVTIVPTMIISLRMMYGAVHPTDIVVACIIATACATTGGLIIDRIIGNRKRKV